MGRPRLHDVKRQWIMIKFRRDLAQELLAELDGITGAATAVHHACAEFLRQRRRESVRPHAGGGADIGGLAGGNGAVAGMQCGAVNDGE